MFNFLKFEIRGFMSKKVLCNIALCALLMFCGCDMLPSYRTMKYKSPIWGYFHVQKE